MQTERRVAANPQTKPTDLGCESADRLLPSTDTIAIYYYYSSMPSLMPSTAVKPREMIENNKKYPE